MKPEIQNVGGLPDQSPHDLLLTDQELGLSTDLLKKFPGCEHYTDEQAQEIVYAIKQLAEILYILVIPEESHTIDSCANNIDSIALPQTDQLITQKTAA